MVNYRFGGEKLRISEFFGIYNQKGLNKTARLNPRFCEGKRRFCRESVMSFT